MNYTTFFVVLSTIGVLVFVGIFGAAWMSAADQPARGGDTIPVNPLAPSPSPEAPNDQLTTEASNESPSSTSDEVSSASSTETSTNSEAQDHTLPSSPSSAEQSLSLSSSSSSSSEATTSGSSHIAREPPRMAPGESFDGIAPTEFSCSFEKLTKEKGEIIPSYTNEDSCQQWLVEYEEGYSVDITVDRLELDGENEDYVLISPDENTVSEEDNPVLSWTLTEKRYYKIPYKGTAYILFVTHKSDTDKPRGFRIIYNRSGELTTTPSSTTAGPIPTPDDEESIRIHAEFSTSVQGQIQEFRTAIAGLASAFCQENNILLNYAITYENVFLQDQQPCLSTWPNSESCSSFNMAIPVDTKNSTYQLTKEHLQAMWNEWSGEELNGIRKTDGPNYKKHVIIWFLLSVAFIILFSVCLLFLWQWQLRNSHIPEENKPRESQTIEVPPFFEYMDSRYDDPEYLPYSDSMYHMGTESSSDDRFTFGTLPPYTKRPSNVSTFQFGRPSNAGIDNDAFILEEEDEEEYEIMNKASLTKEVKKVNNEN